MPDRPLTKSLYLAGLQCHRRLWWTVHEPDAPELAPDEGALWNLEQGKQVGLEARRRFPDLPAEVPVEADGGYARIDLLERGRDGDRLIEVKSATSVKEEYLSDVAFQTHVARRSGLTITTSEVMHLDGEVRAPDLDRLFVRADVSEAIQPLLPSVAREIEAQRAMLAGPLPDVPIGEHCRKPAECPFLERCWAGEPDHHLRTLHGIRAKALGDLTAQGFITLHDLPADLPFKNRIHARQRDAVHAGRIHVEPGLREALEPFRAPLAFLDFETVSTAIPVYAGCGPWTHLPSQVSVHVVAGDGGMRHHEWLVEGPGDPRPAIARTVVEACRGAEAVVAYFSSFEDRCLQHLAAAVPELAPELESIRSRLLDLLPVVREHVYHPEFRGSFSLKSVLPALVPALAYADLEIARGDVASARIGRILFPGGERAPDPARERAALLAYCERDTLAMVQLLDRLRALALENP